jgi:transposase
LSFSIAPWLILLSTLGLVHSKRVVLVMDQAGWHTSAQVVVPEGIHVVFLPPYSPHMQPAERLWPILNEALANRVFNLDELLERVEKRCGQILKLTGLVSGLTQFHWWKAFQC